MGDVVIFHIPGTEAHSLAKYFMGNHWLVWNWEHSVWLAEPETDKQMVWTDNHGRIKSFKIHGTIDMNYLFLMSYPDSKVHGANMGPILGRKGPGGPHVGPMNIAIWVSYQIFI